MRFIFTFLFLVLSSNLISAQSQISTTNFELGAIGGLGVSNVVGSDAPSDNGLRLGIHLGGYAQFAIDDKFGFRPELDFISIKGTSSGSFKTYYFDLPLLGTYDLDDKFKVMAGVQPSILLNASVGDGRGNITNDIRTIDLGLIAGIWYQIDDKWGAGFRAVRGISKVGADGRERTFNANCQISIGYRLK